MKKRFVVLALVGVFIAYAIHERQSSTIVTSRTGDPPFDMATPTSYLTASAIHRDPASIRASHANRLIGVTGKVVSFEQGWRNDRYLMLETGADTPPLRVHLEPDSRILAEVAAKPGSVARLGCKHIGQDGSRGGLSYLNQCYFYGAE